MTQARRQVVTDIAIACVVCALASVWGARYWTAWTGQGGQPLFYQSTFEPAVMIACGHGFAVSSPQTPALADFLEQRRDAISCAEIPAGAEQLKGQVLQRPVFYLMWFVGLAWRVLGISWSGMGPVVGVLFGASAALIYGICRLAMGRVLALAVVFGVSTSTLQLSYFPHLRDFDKEPFTLALFFILGMLVIGPARPRRVVCLAAVYGAVLAVAYGFRPDFLIDIPLFLIALLVFLDGGPLRHIRTKLVACAMFAVAFVAVGWPVLSSVYREGGCQWHTIVLGLQAPFNDALVVQPAPYDAGYLYSDGYANAQITNFAERTSPPHPRIVFCSAEYDAQSSRYLRTLALTFPADFAIRAYASARTLAEAPFLIVKPPIANWGAPFFVTRSAWLMPLRGAGIWIVGIATLVAAAVSLRLGLFLLVFMLYVGGYPALQFNTRHFFHLEFVVWWAAGFVAQQVISALWRTLRSRTVDVAAMRDAGVRVAAMAGCPAAIIVLPLMVLRAYQTMRVKSLLSSYMTAAKVTLEPSAAAPDGERFLTSAGIGRFGGDLIEVDLDRERCGERADITFQYDPATPDSVLSHTVTIPRTPGSPGITRVFLGVFEHFAGVRFPVSMAGCVAGASRLSDPNQFPLLVDAMLPPGWEELPLHQRLARWEPHWIN